MSNKNRGGKHLSPQKGKKFSLKKLSLPSFEAVKEKMGSFKQLRLPDLKAVPKKWWIIGGSVAALMLLVVLMVVFANSKLDKLSYDEGSITLNESVDEIKTQLETENGVDSEVLAGINIENLSMSDLDIIDDDGVLNVLLLGTDEREFEFSDNARADAILLMSLDLNKHTIKLVSIERGLTVPVLLEGAPYGWVDLITHCFNYGGAELMMKEVEECLRVKVDRYVRVNLNVFIKVIDVLGGVDIELTQQEVDYLNGRAKYIYHGTEENDFKGDLVVGMNHLDGPLALAYSRLRGTDSNWYRIARQRNMIIACVNSLKGADLSTLNNLCDEVLPLVRTNFSKKEISTLMLQAPKFIGANIEQMTIPAEGTFTKEGGAGGISVYAPIFQENAAVLQKFLYGTANEE